jgi:superfamily II DNA helicase RecQ
MRVKVVTLAYDEALRGFPREPMDRLASDGSILEVRDHFFVHMGIPHLTLIVVLDEKNGTSRQDRPSAAPDPAKDLPESLQPVYRNLRNWRNERAKNDGVPAYAIFRNIQLVDICLKLPRTLAALREIEGIGDATCAKYGKEVLGLIADVPDNKTQARQTGDTEKKT